MYKKYKQIIISFVLGALIFGGLPVMAISGVKAINAYYDNIKIMVDGKEITSDAEPFIYDGRTYVPIRTIAEALGINVNWDDSTKTVNISNAIISKEDDGKDITYEDLARNGDNYLGTEVKFTGKIIQVLPADDYSIGYRVNVVKKNNDWEGTIYLSSNFSKINTRFLEGDIIEFAGLPSGYISYNSITGKPIEIPFIFADSIKLSPTKTTENNDEKAYSAGEEVPIYDKQNNQIGYLKIISVTETSDRNKYEKSNPAQVVKIDYEYRNANSSDEIYISHIHFQVIDSQGGIGEYYPNIDREGAKQIPKGSYSKSSCDFGLENASKTIILNYKSSPYSDIVDIKFELPVK